MQSFHITGIEDAQFPKDDRTKVAIRFQTTDGLKALVVSADHLASLITMLEGLEHSIRVKKARFELVWLTVTTSAAEK